MELYIYTPCIPAPPSAVDSLVYLKIMHILWPDKSTALAGLQTLKKKIQTRYNWIKVFFLGKAPPLCYIVLVSTTIVHRVCTHWCVECIHYHFIYESKSVHSNTAWPILSKTLPLIEIKQEKDAYSLDIYCSAAAKYM